MGCLSKEEFETKYNIYSKELMNISYGYTRNKDASLDVIQNVFYKFFNYKKTFNSPNEEKYWLIRVTINESKDLLRKNKKITIVDDDKLDYIQTNDEIKDERLNKVSLLVKLLPDKYKKVIILHYYDLLSINEISKTLNISESAVKKRLERARNMLKDGMEE